MIEFKKATYRSQVLRLRKLAREALTRFPITVKKISFINYGENATFRILATDGRQFLLRIHRCDYHTDLAILEELNWLKVLSQNKIRAPKPIRSKRKKWIETCQIAEVDEARQCVLFEWINGYFLEKSIRPRQMYELGQLLASLQRLAPRGRSRHRNYWNAEGLVGRAAKFGSIENLRGVHKKDQTTINRVRPVVLKHLRTYERRFPKKMGTIHADLHFGNLIQTKTGLCPIDFDDSGYGFLVYDLVIPLLSAGRSLGPKRSQEFAALRLALLDGYRSQADFNKHDEVFLKHLTAARKIAMLGWLNSRSDNPRLAKYLKGSAKSTAEFLLENYRC